MPSVTSVIDTIATPPLASLQQVLDTNGPYSGGDHVLSSFHTDGAFLLPAGTYDVGGTYGAVLVASSIPIAAGRVVGFNGIVHGQDRSNDRYLDPIAQLNLYHQFPITGAWLCTASYSIDQAQTVLMWPVYIGSGGTVGLHVFPNFSFDLFYLCVL